MLVFYKTGPYKGPVQFDAIVTQMFDSSLTHFVAGRRLTRAVGDLPEAGRAAVVDGDQVSRRQRRAVVVDVDAAPRNL